MTTFSKAQGRRKSGRLLSRRNLRSKLAEAEGNVETWKRGTRRERGQGAVRGHFLRQMKEWSGGRGRNDKEMGAEIFAEAETGTRYGFISRSPKGEKEGRRSGKKGGEKRERQ